MSETLVNPDKREEAASAPAEAAARVNLLDFDAAGLKAWCESIGEKPFRARQLTRWVHRHLVCDFNEMTDLAKTFRAKPSSLRKFVRPKSFTKKKSSDGTRKWLLPSATAMLLKPSSSPEDDRGTLCISSQAGAPWVPLLLNGQAGFQPQSHYCGNRGPALDGRARASAATAASRIRMTASSAMSC